MRTPAGGCDPWGRANAAARALAASARHTRTTSARALGTWRPRTPRDSMVACACGAQPAAAKPCEWEILSSSLTSRQLPRTCVCTSSCTHASTASYRLLAPASQAAQRLVVLSIRVLSAPRQQRARARVGVACFRTEIMRVGQPAVTYCPSSIVAPIKYCCGPKSPQTWSLAPVATPTRTPHHSSRSSSTTGHLLTHAPPPLTQEPRLPT